MQSINECPICNGTAFSHYLTCTDYTVSHETFNLLQCKACDLVITSPGPSDAELGKYYLSDDYISHAKTNKSIFDKFYGITRHYTLYWKLNLIKSHICENNHPTLLDF